MFFTMQYILYLLVCSNKENILQTKFFQNLELQKSMIKFSLTYRLIIFRSTHNFANSAKIWQPWTKIGTKFKPLKNKQSLEIDVNQWTINKTDVSFYGWHGENMKQSNNVPIINLYLPLNSNTCRKISWVSLKVVDLQGRVMFN